MQRYLMNFSTKDMPVMRSDVLIVGSGVAGLSAAWAAAKKGLSVLVAVRDEVTDSNTNKAQGGIAASFGEDDNPELHLKDTLVAGAGLSDENISRITVTEGPERIKELMENGAVFDRNADGSLALGREGCHCRNRIVHAKGDATGAEVARSLIEITRVEPLIRFVEHTYVVDLLISDGRCYGAVAIHEGQKVQLRAKAVVIATGGLGRIFCHTTNPEGATGSGAALCYRAGAEVEDMEFVQFHPTALAFPDCPNFLISEAVRGAGAILRNMKGERFMPKYHEMAELAPRDVVARCIFKEMQEAGSDHIYIDATVIGTDQCSDAGKTVPKGKKASELFPMIAETCREYGIDIDKEPVPIAPAAHYMMGGVKTDEMGRTNIKGLYAAGEAACTGLQGANRLASNSLLEGLVFGRRAALDISDRIDALGDGMGLSWSSGGLRHVADDDTKKETVKLQQLMEKDLGIRRNRDGIQEAIDVLENMQEHYAGFEAEKYDMLDLRGRIQTSLLIAKAALRREESRGAHYRSDFPEKNDKWKKHISDSISFSD